MTKQWIKRNADTGKFMDVKQDGTPFKGVRKEKQEYIQIITEGKLDKCQNRKDNVDCW